MNFVLEDVTKCLVLDRVPVDISEGRCVALPGPSGCGKNHAVERLGRVDGD